MDSNGWIFYDRVHLESRDWRRVLDALRDAGNAARAASKSWPMREITERAVLIREGDSYVPVSGLAAGLRQAQTDPGIVAVRFDLSQGGTDDPGEPEYMKIRACQIVAQRHSGLTLYASSPNEPEVMRFCQLSSSRRDVRWHEAEGGGGGPSQRTRSCRIRSWPPSWPPSSSGHLQRYGS